MANYIEAHGGKVITNATVTKFIVENNQCKGVETENGDSIFGTRAVVSELEPKQTFLRLIGEEKLDNSFVSMVRNYQFGNVSPGRAPEGKHTLIMDTFVPYKLTTGQNWEDIKEDYIREVLLGQLRRHTSNMDDDNILGQYIETGDTLQQANWCFVDGNTTGGMRIQGQMGYFRPFPGYAHYRSPVKNLYMTGPHCHPGGGITAQGMIAANVMLEDMGLKDTDDFDY